MSELTPAEGGPNRVFVFIAIGLVLLLLVLIAGVVGIIIFQQQAKPAVVLPTPTRVAVTVVTPTRPLVAAPTLVFAGNTPEQTLVVGPLAGGTVFPIVTSTIAGSSAISGTVGPGTGTPTGGLPQTGLGEDLLLLTAGVVLVLIIFAARRARSTPAA